MRGDWIWLFVPALILCAGLAIHAGTLLNHDVAWFAWGAREWLRGAVIGTDLTDPNFPLAFLLYAPPAALTGVLPFAPAIRLWVLLLAAAVIALAWRDVSPRSRMVVLSALAAFVVLGWPREFAQREQIAMLLVFPYVIPADRRGWRAIAAGALAGIGFAIKPYFLIAWLLVEFGRKLFRPEQLALVSVGAVYALSLAVVFPVFTFELLPATLDAYDSFNRSDAAVVALPPLVLAAAALIVAAAAHDPLARALAMAALGFGIAGALQLKFYDYHFVPAWGFVTTAFAALLCSTKGARQAIVVVLIGLVTIHQARPATMWWSDAEGRAAMRPHLLEALHGMRSFAVVGVHPYPAFPTAIDADALGIRFVGTASSHWFLPAAAAGNAFAAALARRQMLTDLRRRPEIVMVDTDWRGHTRIAAGFNGLALLLADPEVALEWTSYRPFGSLGAIEFYRRH